MLGDEFKQVLAEGHFEGVTLGYCAINFPFRQAAVDAAGGRGLGVVTMNPLGGGLIPQQRRAAGFLRRPEDRSVVEAAIRFNISQPAITAALVGFTTNAAHGPGRARPWRTSSPTAQSTSTTMRGKLREPLRRPVHRLRLLPALPAGHGHPQDDGRLQPEAAGDRGPGPGQEIRPPQVALGAKDQPTRPHVRSAASARTAAPSTCPSWNA